MPPGRPGYLLNDIAKGTVALIKGEQPPDLINPEIFGTPKLHPDRFGRGSAVPVTEGGPAIY